MSRIRTTKQAAEIRHGLAIGGYWKLLKTENEHREDYARWVLGGGLAGRAFMRASDWGDPDNEPTRAKAFLATRRQINEDEKGRA